jgi:hypothetical protein
MKKKLSLSIFTFLFFGIFGVINPAFAGGGWEKPFYATPSGVYGQTDGHGAPLYLIKNIDPKTFQAFCDTKECFKSYSYGKDKNGIYHQSKQIFVDSLLGPAFMIPLEEIDYDSFEYLYRDYAKDKNHVYYIDSIILENLDAGKVSYIYSKEEQGEKIVYFLYQEDIYSCKEMNCKKEESISAEEIKKFKNEASNYKKENSHSGYEIKDGKLFLHGYEVPSATYIAKEKVWRISETKKVNEYGIVRENGVVQIPNCSTPDKNIDFPTYKDLGRPYLSVDKNFVYYEGKKVEGSDGESFKKFNCSEFEVSYFKDKNHVYRWDGFRGFYILDKVDTESFEQIGNSCYFKDKNNYRYPVAAHTGKGFTREGVVDESMMPLYLLRKHNLKIPSLYSPEGKNISEELAEEIQEEERESKEVFVFPYYYPENKPNIVKYDTKEFSVDMETFEVIYDQNDFELEKKVVNENNGIEGFFHPYSKDKNHVYYEGDIIEGADPNSFFMLQESEINSQNFNNLKFSQTYSADKNSVYFKNKKIKNADKNSFKIIKRIKKGTPEDFFTLDYSRDKNNFYQSGEIITGIDIDSFKVLDNGYSKDKYSIFLKDISLRENKKIPRGEFITHSMRLSTIHFSSHENELKNISLYAVADKQIINKVFQGKFYPNRTINFAEASKILVNTFFEITPEKKADDWWTPFVEKLEQEGIKTFPPEKELTGDDMVDLFLDVLEWKEQQKTKSS